MVDAVVVGTLLVAGDHAGLQQARLGVHPTRQQARSRSLRETVTRTGDDAEELREREEEVEELGKEEEKQRLGEVTKDAHLSVTTLSHTHRSEGDAGGVGEGVADEAARRVAVEVEERERGGDEGHDDHRREDVVAHIVYASRQRQTLTVRSADDDVDDVDAKQRAGDHDGLGVTHSLHAHLTHLQSVDARVNVDAVGAEDAQHDDVHVVPPVYASLHSTDPTEVDRGAVRTTAHLRDERHEATEPGEGVLRFAQNATQETRCDCRHQRSRWERDGGGLVLRPVGLHQREGGYTGDDQLVSPAQLQDVVHKPQQRHQTDGENGSVVVRHLGVRLWIVAHLLIGLRAEHFVDDERQNLNRSRHNSQGFRTSR